MKEADFNGCEGIIDKVKETTGNTAHSQVAKTRLLESKLTECKGELRSSFRAIEEAKVILRRALVKEEQDRYIKIYRTSETYLELECQTAHIYLKQLNHDMCLKSVTEIEEALRERDERIESNFLYPEIQELKAQS